MFPIMTCWENNAKKIQKVEMAQIIVRNQRKAFRGDRGT